MLLKWAVLSLFFSKACLGYSSCCTKWSTINALLNCISTTSNSDIVIATVVSNDILLYASNAIIHNSFYLNRRGYKYEVITNDFNPSDKRWNKIKAATTLLDSTSSSYIVLTDADLFFLDFDFRIENIIEKYPEAMMILSEDSMDVGNTGFMILRNHAWTKAFFELWWETRDLPGTHCDQHVLNYLFSRMDLEDYLRIAVIPAKQLNSIWPAIENFEESDPILHLMGETNSVRSKVAEHIKNDTCARLGGVMVQAPDLLPYRVNISQRILRELKEEVIMQEWEQITARCDEFDSSEHDFELLRETLGHLCDPNKRSDAPSVAEKCMGLLDQAIKLHMQALSTLSAVTESAVTPSVELFYRSHITMLLFDKLELTGCSLAHTSVRDPRTSNEVHSHLYHHHLYHLHQQQQQRQPHSFVRFTAADQALDALENMTSVLDMKDPTNSAFIHHKRGLLFTFISQCFLKEKQWQSVLEWEKIAITEFGNALQVTPQTSVEFGDFVLSYVYSATRLSVSFKNMEMFEEAAEWAEIALNNAQLRLQASSNEQRVLVGIVRNLENLNALIANKRNGLMEINDFVNVNV